jgi:hypothetical protein
MCSKKPSFVVIDFSFYYGVNREIIPKEVAFYVPESGHQETYVIAPPYSLSNLPPHIVFENRHRSDHCVDHKWNDGIVPYSDLNYLMNRNSLEYLRVFVYGKERVDFVSQILGRRVIQIEEDGNIFPSNIIHTCTIHNSEKVNFCPLIRCLKFGNFLLCKEITMDASLSFLTNKLQI